MKYQVIHKTYYSYGETVSLCQNIAMLTPRDTYYQKCLKHELIVHPKPQVSQEYCDVFGNHLTYFSVEEEHDSLSVTSIFIVENHQKNIADLIGLTMPWESLSLLLEKEDVEEKQFCYPTMITTANETVSNYASLSFTPGCLLFDAVNDLMHRIYADFKFKPGYTTIATPPSEIMQLKAGVCQDFAHLALACLRSKGLPARYVSGYIETVPPKGQKKLVGADASHAWFSVFIPGFGWMDFDPTNNKIPNGQYITTGWGRDYFDIVPLKGILLGNGDHELKVEVDVKPLGD